MTSGTLKRICSNCGSQYHYQTFCTYKRRESIAVNTPLPRQTKPISKHGKHAKLWVTFRDKVAIPYLDKKYGHVCAQDGCNESEHLDVDHIKNRGSNPDKRYDIHNLQYLCRPHHRAKTDGKS